MNKKRLFAALILVVAFYFLPWWLVFALGGFFFFFFPDYVEIILLGMAMDSLYAPSVPGFSYFDPYQGAIVGILLFMALSLIKRRLR